MLELHFTVLPTFTNETWQNSWKQLDLPKEWKAGFQFPKHIRTAAATLAGKTMLKKVYQAGDIEERFRKDVYGRPYLLNVSFDFNISHAGNLVVLLVSDTRIGIDIEQMTPLVISDFEHCFTRNEWESIRQHPETFYRYWTIKEAVMKADGRGMQLPLHSILINQHLTKAVTDRSEWQLISVSINPGYACAVACLPSMPDHLSIIQTPVFNI